MSNQQPIPSMFSTLCNNRFYFDLSPNSFTHGIETMQYFFYLHFGAFVFNRNQPGNRLTAFSNCIIRKDGF